MPQKTIGILGDGSWGTALACLLGENGHPVRLWGPFPEVTGEIRTKRTNHDYLPDLRIPDAVEPTNDMGAAVGDAGLIIFATPVLYLRKVAEQAAETLNGNTHNRLVCVAKGIERDTLLLGSQIVGQLTGEEDVCVMVGPSHAEEVARHCPTSVVSAARDRDFTEAVRDTFMNDHFRVYTGRDPLGAEIGASVKNVIAIAAGICDGLELGDNAKSALLTRGLAEITRLGIALGAQRDTFSGLSGIGDLITTCISPHGRNLRVGLQIGRGKPIDDVIEEMKPMVPEGVYTTQSVTELAERHRVDMPIARAVRAVLFEKKPPMEAVHDLMTREPKAERVGLRPPSE